MARLIPLGSISRTRPECRTPKKYIYVCQPRAVVRVRIRRIVVRIRRRNAALRIRVVDRAQNHTGAKGILPIFFILSVHFYFLPHKGKKPLKKNGLRPLI